MSQCNHCVWCLARKGHKDGTTPLLFPGGAAAAFFDRCKVSTRTDDVLLLAGVEEWLDMMLLQSQK